MTRSAGDYARSVPSRAAFDWAELEVAAFSGHPSIQDAISPDRAGKRDVGRSSTDVATWVVGAVLVLAQVQAFLRLTAGSRLGTHVLPTGAVHDTALLSALSLLMLVVLAVLAARRRRTRAAAAPGLGALVLGSALACGVNLLLVGLKGANNDVSRWPLWSIPSLLCVALGIVLFKTDSGPGARIRTAVRDLSPTEADVVRRQVRDALEMLHSRRILRDEEVARAKGVELGMLSLSMFPLDQKTPQRR